MRVSKYFLPIAKEEPAEAKIASHRLMLRAGMIKQASAGIYSWLPLGFRVLKKIEKIVEDEQVRAGHIPMLMPTLQPAELWKESGRYDDYGKEMLRISDRQGRDLLYGPTNEEQITDIFRTHISSYKELPTTLFHIQWKFRDELRPRFGVMRGREFFMKDGYSFDIDKKSAVNSYNRHMVSYLKTYERLGLKAIPMKADTGPIGGDYSHEFLVLAKTGESNLFYDKSVAELSLDSMNIDYQNPESIREIVDKYTQYYARTEETHDDSVFRKVDDRLRETGKGIEVGQIFYFGTKYSEAMNARVTMPDGSKIPVEMGSHGIGVSRLVGAIIEANNDEKGIVWPKNVSPFDVCLVNLKQSDPKTDELCERLYTGVSQMGREVLYDDRDERAGVKFNSMDLIGIPYRITVGPRGAKSGKVELVYRNTGKSEEYSIEGLMEKLCTLIN